MMNPAFVRNILSLAVLGFVLVIGFQTGVPDAAASSMSCGGPNPGCQNCCGNEYQDCNNDCLQDLFDCFDAADQELESCESCQDGQYRAENPIECAGYSGGENCENKHTIAINECYDAREECDVDCDDAYDDCLAGCPS